MKKIFRLLLLLAAILLFNTCLFAAEKACMNVKTITLVKGETYNLKVIQGGKFVNTSKWNSQNTNVVSVSSKGKITAKSRGSSNIEAQINGETVNCVVTVIDKASSNTIRYCVFIMDASSSMEGTPLTKAKGAVKKFINKLKDSEGRNYMALITLSTNPKIIYSFTDDYKALKKKVDKISAGGKTNINDALKKADLLLSSVPGGDNNIKNVVLLSDGLPDSGNKKESGRYSKEDYNKYAFANADYSTDYAMKKKYYIYALGFFYNTSGKRLEFGKKHMKDLASTDKNYIVTDVNYLEKTVSDIADSITTIRVSPDQIKMYIGDSGYNLELFVNGKKVKGTWTSNDPKVASVEKNTGYVTPQKTGTAVITATYNGKTATCKVTVENPTVTVLFDGNGGGTTVKSIKVIYSHSYGNLPDATKQGYDFVGWFTEQSGGELVSSDTTVTQYKNHTLYAHWKEKKQEDKQDNEQEWKHKYKYYDLSMTRKEASRYCKEHNNGYLACIGSEAEQLYIVSLMPKKPGKYSYWIGGAKISDRTWIWDDGTPMEYENFDTDFKEGDQNRDSNENYCAMIAIPRISYKKKGEWFDTYNNGEGSKYDGHYALKNFGFICEWEE